MTEQRKDGAKKGRSKEMTEEERAINTREGQRAGYRRRRAGYSKERPELGKRTEQESLSVSPLP